MPTYTIILDDGQVLTEAVPDGDRWYVGDSEYAAAQVSYILPLHLYVDDDGCICAEG